MAAPAVALGRGPNAAAKPASPPMTSAVIVAPAGRDPRRVHAGRRRHPDLQRLAVRPERGAQPAGLEQRQALGGAGALLVEPEQPRGGVRRPCGAAHGGRVPAARRRGRASGSGAPIASKPAAYAASASPTLRSSSAASAIAAGAVGALRWAMPGR